MKCMLLIAVILVVAAIPNTEAGWRRFTRWMRQPVPIGFKRGVEEREVVDLVTKQEFANTTGLTGEELDLYFEELDENDNGVLDGEEVDVAIMMYSIFA